MIRIMTFNIRGATFADGANAWPARGDLNAAAILACDPDIIGFQEYQEGNRLVYDRLLPAYAYETGPPFNRAQRPLFNAIYWKRERFGAQAQGHFFFSLTPERWSKSWDAARVRGLHWVTLRDKQHGTRLHLLNTHLDHQGERARLESARLLGRFAAERLGDEPAVLVGDFNSSSDQEGEETVYRLLGAAGFRDTFGERPAGEPVHTYHGFKGAAFDPAGYPVDLRLDWILVRGGLAAVRSEIIRDEAPPLFPSDHYPVVADIAYESGEKPGSGGR